MRPSQKALRQPTGPVEVDWSNPLARSLVLCVPFNTGGTAEIVGQSLVTPQGTMPGWSAQAAGRGRGTFAGLDRLNSIATTSLGTSFTLFSAATRYSTGAIHGMMGRDANPPRHYQFRVLNTNVPEFVRFNTTPTAYLATGTTTVGIGPFTMAATSNGTAMSVYLNGRSDATGTITGTPSSADNAVRLGVSFDTLTSDSRFDGILHVCLAWTRVLSATEIQEISLAPWQIVRPRRQRVWVEVGGTTVSIAGVIAGASDIAGAARATYAAAGMIAGASDIVGAARATYAANGTIAGASDIVGAARATYAAAGTIAGVSDLSAAGSLVKMVAGIIAGISDVAGSARTTYAAAGAIAGASDVAGSAAVARGVSGEIAGVSGLTASLTGILAASGAIAGGSTLAGAVSLNIALSGLIAAISSITANGTLTGGWTPVTPPSTTWTPAGAPSTTWTPVVPPSTTWT